jgi:hypothetical protein
VSVSWAYVEFYNRFLREADEGGDQAEALLHTALRHAQTALGENPKSGQARDVAASIKLSLGTHLCRAGHADQAVPLYKEAVASIQSLCADFPWTADYWITLRWFHDDIAANLQTQGKVEEARDALRNLSEWLTTITPNVPAEPGPQKLLRQTRRHLADQLRAAGLPQEADKLVAVVD